ncbi:VacJ family lipoprotein [Porticoccus hydrocarbonoclasticus]|jgi:phospholipid-binding lipoprotein MlaA|uniref:MlaA family lipoprotein n=1 Tax=Porticoccus hydrocarbonoclasticus TaxID=1073414 RepID=UPI002356BB40|nr:VacJ family lipoprotein [Porticoccus hydrocarbonoclasticus]|tara:strand:- start:184 stop:879 length:696 start_codon:yes stop_codon:yes gene_type:complete
MKKIVLLLAGVMLSTHIFAAGNPDDPWEGFNRKMFAFNDTVDTYTLKPIAKGYRAVTPDPVERGVSRMFSNVGEVVNVFNDLLQGKFRQAGNDTGRFVINTTIGLVGFFDVADRFGLPKNDGEDFGQTLGVWGVDSGPYLVLPLIGPSTVRDGPARIVDRFINPINEIDHVPTRNQIYGAEVISTRADLLEAEKFVRGERYSFIRDAYLQRRKFLLTDGGVEDDFGDYKDF